MHFRSIFIIFFTIILIVSCFIPINEGMKGCRKGKRSSNYRRGHGRRRINRGGLTFYNNNPYYFSEWRPIYPFYSYIPTCKSGCGYMGNGVVGCMYPSNMPNGCIFASDCYGC